MRPCKHSKVPCAACAANRARVAAWAAANPARLAKRCRRWLRRNPAKVRETKRRDNQKRRFRKRTLAAAERAREAGCIDVVELDVVVIWRRDDGVCGICAQFVPHPGAACEPWEEPTLDHIIPKSWSWGPGHVESNVQLAHRGCNSWKGTRVLCEVDVSDVPF